MPTLAKSPYVRYSQKITISNIASQEVNQGDQQKAILHTIGSPISSGSEYIFKCVFWHKTARQREHQSVTGQN